MNTIHEPAREIPVAHKCDVCVVGGSCTGVFAAVQAARLGARVALIEKNGMLGGTATAGLVTVWHSLHDTVGERRIIAGLTFELMERMGRKGFTSVTDPKGPRAASTGYVFNPPEMMIELDELVAEAGVRTFLHARFASPIMDGDRLAAVAIEDKTGRRAVKAGVFVDASGDGDVVHRMGLPTRKDDQLQPPTTCAFVTGLGEVRKRNEGFRLGNVAFDAKYETALRPGFLWQSQVIGVPDTTMVAGTRVHGADLSDADELTAAEIEGRRQVRLYCRTVRENFDGGEHVALAALPANIGTRETRHACCLHQLTEREVLEGTAFEDAIGYGSYRVDVHHADTGGLTFRYLDGREEVVGPGQPRRPGRWRDATDTNPTFYQIPYRCLVPRGATNVLAAGRILDADRGAFGALRVMVNCNQMGQAAGAAAYQVRDTGCGVADVDVAKLRDSLKGQGCVIDP